jgi:pyrroline-5-carboxylate reductase
MNFAKNTVFDYFNYKAINFKKTVLKDPMNKYQIGFIGAGKMATAIAAGLIKKGLYQADAVIASDISDASRSYFSSKTGGVTCENNEQITADCATIILAVKPQVASEVCSKLNLKPGTHVISIAAGLKLASLKKWLKTDKITRVMPNTPLMVGKGASAYCVAEGVTDSEKETVEKIFGCAGIIYPVSENDIDAVTGLSGSGPAYVFEFIQALCEAGKENGLDDETSLQLAVQTVAGAAEMLVMNMGTPDELRDAVTSPNGTTYAALQVMKKENFRGLISKSIKAAVDRSIELGKDS